MYESALEGKNYEGPHLSGELSAGADFVFAPPRNSNRAKKERDFISVLAFLHK
jgi:hypothetical protein